MTSPSRIALVTGATGGLGTAITRRLAADGMTVITTDFRGDVDVTGDLSSSQGAVRVIDEVLDRFGSLDVLVANAGLQYLAPMGSFPLEQWDRLMAVMVTSVQVMLQRSWTSLTRQPGGRFIAIASTSSWSAEAHKLAYTTAKHAVIGIVRSAAVEGAPHGLSANAVAPGWMRTPLLDGQVQAQAARRGVGPQEFLQQVEHANPAGRFIEPEEVAQVVAFLASSVGSGVNGAVVPVDLGSSAS